MVVVKGRIKLSNVNVSGKEIVLHFLVPGNIYGEIAAMDGGERAANAVALPRLHAGPHAHVEGASRRDV